MSDLWREIADPYWHESVPKKPIDTDTPKSFIDIMIEKVWNGELPSDLECKYIIRNSIDAFKFEPNVLDLEPPITLCGDIHGQYNDMLQIFKFAGLPPFTKYLFLGDYVDRGDKSLEVILLLCLFKLKYPSQFYLLRGNHESMNITRMYGFYEELMTKYRNESVYQMFQPLFESLPIAALVGKKIFCVHGGISQHCPTIQSIAALNRFSEIPVKGALTDLLWADPSPDGGEFTESGRNAGHKFGQKATNDFLKRNHIDLIIRAHQLMQDGFSWTHNNKVLTIFSAPNYELTWRNKAAMVTINEELKVDVFRFSSSPPENEGVLYSKFVY